MRLPVPCPARYPLQALIDASGLSYDNARRTCGVSGTEWVKAGREGLTEIRADRYAVRLGFIPWQIWPQLLDDAIADLERECEAHGCTERFVPAPRHPDQKFCSDRCRSRVHQKKKYAANPEPKRAAVRAYDTANHAYKVQANRSYYRRNRVEILEQQRVRYAARRAASDLLRRLELEQIPNTDRKQAA